MDWWRTLNIVWVIAAVVCIPAAAWTVLEMYLKSRYRRAYRCARSMVAASAAIIAVILLADNLSETVEKRVASFFDTSLSADAKRLRRGIKEREAIAGTVARMERFLEKYADEADALPVLLECLGSLDEDAVKAVNVGLFAARRERPTTFADGSRSLSAALDRQAFPRGRVYASACLILAESCRLLRVGSLDYLPVSLVGDAGGLVDDIRYYAIEAAWAFESLGRHAEAGYAYALAYSSNSIAVDEQCLVAARDRFLQAGDFAGAAYAELLLAERIFLTDYYPLISHDDFFVMDEKDVTKSAMPNYYSGKSLFNTALEDYSRAVSLGQRLPAHFPELDLDGLLRTVRLYYEDVPTFRYAMRSSLVAPSPRELGRMARLAQRSGQTMAKAFVYMNMGRRYFDKPSPSRVRVIYEEEIELGKRCFEAAVHELESHGWVYWAARLRFLYAEEYGSFIGKDEALALCQAAHDGFVQARKTELTPYPGNYGAVDPLLLAARLKLEDEDPAEARKYLRQAARWIEYNGSGMERIALQGEARELESEIRELEMREP